MDPTVLSLLQAGGGWVVAICIALIALLPKKGTLEAARLAQLRQDVDAEREEVRHLTTRLDELDRKLSYYRRRDLAWRRYFALIQLGVEAGTIPPWPEFPDALGEYNE